ncbi:TniQ family protein [Cupriavidus sp. UYPR2.512]|uniref:TniQ family protein n=1 Tax=Cupriavidus sp. UYPR2.512 TaxID=1080187 RepID=UPI00039C1E45|nr:TniQ family protein [Cupriavidus necator]
MQNVRAIPYVPAPYPDEWFGHWIARVRFYVGAGAWRPLLLETGNAERLQSTTLDMFSFSLRIEALLTALNTSYDDALAKLTTFPYWHTFHSAGPSSELLPGSRKFHLLTAKRGHIATTTLVAIGVSRSTGGAARKANFCSACIAQDLEDRGEPYLHRSHQLPNIGYCDEHRIPLSSECPKCGSSPLGGNTIETALLRRRCRCGFDLAEIVDASLPSESRSLLIDNSMLALRNIEANWSREQIVAWTNRTLSERGKSARTILIQEFLSEGDCREEPVAYRNSRFPKLSLRQYPSNFSAPDLCALLAAMQIPLIDVLDEFSKEEVEPPKDLSGRLPTLAAAKARLIRERNGSGRLSSGSLARCYWIVRLRDEAWLRQFPTSRWAGNVPSIPEDRKAILRYLRDPNRAKKTKLSVWTGARIRARIRDGAWFDHALETYLVPISPRRSRVIIKAEELRLRVASVDAALQRLLSQEKMPRRLQYKDLALAANLSKSQFRVTLRRCPDLRNRIDNVNADWPRRRLIRAADELHSKGESLSIWKLCVKASLPMSAELMPMIRRTFRALSRR